MSKNNMNGAGYWTRLLNRKQGFKEAKAYARLATRPTERLIRGQMRASDYRANQEIPGWYNQYRSALDANKGSTDAGYQAALDRINTASQESGARVNENQSSIMDTLRADAANRGSSIDPGLAMSMSDAAASRSASGLSGYQNLATQAANQNAYLGKQSANTYMRQNEALQAERARRQSMTGDLNELYGKRKDIILEYLTKLRPSERQFLIDKKTLNETKRNNNLDFTASQSNNSGGSSKDGPDWNTNKQQATATANTVYSEHPKWKAFKIYNYLISEKDFSPKAAQYAVGQIFEGFQGPKK